MPATLSTCSRDGIPNIGFLSVVHQVDDEHIALSLQYFRKTRKNIEENPRARLLVVEPNTAIEHLLSIEFLRSETEGDTFQRLASSLVYRFSFLLAVDESEQTLFSVASHGDARSGVGAELPIRVGLIGQAAERRASVRVANMSRERILADSVHGQSAQPKDPRRSIALPGMEKTESQLAVPLVTRGRLLGVLCLQSEHPAAFGRADEERVRAVADQIAGQRALVEEMPLAEEAVHRAAPETPAGEGAACVRRYAEDDSIFIDNEHLMRGVAGQVLWLSRLASSRCASASRRNARSYGSSELDADVSSFRSTQCCISRRSSAPHAIGRPRSHPSRARMPERSRVRSLCHSPRLVECAVPDRHSAPPAAMSGPSASAVPSFVAPTGRVRVAGGLLLLALLAQGATQLLDPGVLGMADNGDFWRVTAPAGLHNPVEVATLRHRFVQPTYLRVGPDDQVGQSSASLLARAAMSLPGGSHETFDLRRMGALMLGLASALLALAGLRADGAAILSCVAFAWVLTDPAYLLFFNSFYADAAALLGILGCATILCVRGPPPSRATLGLLLTCAFAIAFSKQAHAASALPAAAALLTIGGRRPSPRIWAAAALCVLVTAGATYHFTRGAGPRFPQINNYNAVFNGIGPSTRDPEHALRALGVGAEWVGHVGTNYFQHPVPEPLARELETLSRVRLASLYASDPIALAAVLRRAQRALTMPHRYLGNYPRSPQNAEPRLRRVPWSFDGLREPLLRQPAAFWTWWLAVGAAIAIIARRRRWTSGPWTAAAFLWTTMAVETTAAILGDGLFALSRHLLVARFASDLLLALVLAAAVELGLRRLRSRRVTTK